MWPQQPLQDAAWTMRGPGGSAEACRPEPKDVLLQTPEPSSSFSTHLRLVSAGFSCAFGSEKEHLTGMEMSERKRNSPFPTVLLTAPRDLGTGGSQRASEGLGTL